MPIKSLDNKLLDKKVLSALLLMSKDKLSGINYIQAVQQGNMSGCLDLIDKGYAEKIKRVEDNYNSSREEKLHYRLTKKGINYLNKILEFADKEFK